MKYIAPILLPIAGALFLLLASCSDSEQGPVVAVAADDPEMTAAISEAQRTLPQFWQVFDSRDQGESDFSLKVRITDEHGVEHFWVSDQERRSGRTFGTIDNDAGTVARVKLGDRIEIPEADITDWLYIRGDKMVGNHTLRPLLKQMPADEVARLKSMMADP